MKSVYEELLDLLVRISTDKPNDRSNMDRNYAIVITELEKLIAFVYYIGMEQ